MKEKETMAWSFYKTFSPNNWPCAPIYSV